LLCDWKKPPPVRKNWLSFTPYGFSQTGLFREGFGPSMESESVKREEK
jgi:hypothetical protein